MSKFKKFMPVVKMADQTDGTLMVYGLVTAEQPDLDREVCDYASTKPYYVNKVDEMKKATSVPGMEQSILPMREMHQLKAIGAGRTIDFDDANKTISMGFNVVDPDAILKFRKGVLIGFSQGGDYIGPKKPDPVFKGCKRYTANPGEVSAVDSPCLPIALVESMKTRQFEYQKTDGSTELRKFHLVTKVSGDENEITVNDTQMIACTEPESEFELNGVFYKAKPPEKIDQLADRIEDLAELVEKGLKLDKGAVANDVITPNLKPTDPVMPMEANITSGLDKKDYSDKERKDMASSGEALPDGSYPIKNVSDLENAIQAYGRASDKPKAKAHIRARAKALGAEGKLPDTWDKPEKLARALLYLKALQAGDYAALQKCMADITDTAWMLQNLSVVTNSQAMEQDGSKLPSQLRQVLEDLVDVFKDMVDEETRGLLAATGGGKEEKSMNAEELELQKKASAHLAKAKEMVKAHVEHMGNVFKAHLDHVTALHQAHLDGVNSAANLDVAKGMAKAHNGMMGAVCKAHHDHVNSLHKAFGEDMSNHLSKIDSPPAQSIVNAATVGGEPHAADPAAAPRNASMDSPGTKALTMEDLQKALKENNEAMEKQHADEMKTLLEAAFGPVVEDDRVAKGGIGNRAEVVSKVHQTHPVTKVGDMTNQNGEVTVQASIVTKDDVIAMGNGDQAALLKVARSITSSPTGVPASLQGMKLLSR
jgi:hypothetical protein